jgi:hypothetical protein
MPVYPPLSRRTWLQSSLGLALGACPVLRPLHAAGQESQPPKKLRLAAINSVYRLRSHAYHICGRFLYGYQKEGFHHQPPFQLVRMLNDQRPKDDLGKETCERHDIALCDSVTAALGGKGKLDVDGVLLIIEHGDYPVNNRNQILYPRFKYFEQIVQQFRAVGRSVPVFVDKHLSYDHEEANQMVTWSQELKFPMMAGSSLPVTWRRPELEPPLGTQFTEGLCCFGFDRGPPEIYLFHALEVLQCMLERRKGGETGVKSVVCVKGNDVWKAADEGKWSWKLLEAALARCPSANVGPIKENVKEPLAILVKYKDGVRGAVLNLVEQVSDFGFAGLVKGEAKPVSTCCYLPAPPGARFFDPLTYNIEKLFLTGKSPYPVERTLLTSTVLDWALRSLQAKSQVVTSPALDIHYQAPADSGFFRGAIVDAL